MVTGDVRIGLGWLPWDGRSVTLTRPWDSSLSSVGRNSGALTSPPRHPIRPTVVNPIPIIRGSRSPSAKNLIVLQNKINYEPCNLKQFLFLVNWTKLFSGWIMRDIFKWIVRLTYKWSCLTEECSCKSKTVLKMTPNKGRYTLLYLTDKTAKKNKLASQIRK